jgi:hypothetical protein
MKYTTVRIRGSFARNPVKLDRDWLEVRTHLEFTRHQVKSQGLEMMRV